MKQTSSVAEGSAHMQVQSAVVCSVVWNETETEMAWRYLKNMTCYGRQGITVWHIIGSDFASTVSVLMFYLCGFYWSQ